ncbi:MAG TPA: LuxR C-terminal-related transcriptional regulator [Accumulibacter sp.]|uniref:LuxR C-terminal-related transcriptional regulator n=1 Tax=Accumulibacter sp. TaxID=2053492 RepID=UPI002C8B058B|nr:LuxR C-terminal-related transcriptional regulator [Accumulibacter sp.]HRF73315.1 LuxR C-terminal-related transcriptional regulator [Accumulibacter sp.]
MPALQIVHSKLHRPRVVGDFVDRGELLRLLEVGSQLPLTLLSAPPGYGKTSLVAHWLDGYAGQGHRCAWLSLDPTDSDPLVFLRYFVAAVRTAMADACRETLNALEEAPQPSLEFLAGSLSNDLDALPTPLVLVLDDYQRIDSPATHALIDRLLARPASHLHLVIVSRHEPALALAASRVRQAMIEIRAPQLQFSDQDSATLIERCVGRAVPPAALAQLASSTEGWPAGVRLAALALTSGHGDDAALAASAFSGATPQVRQYFIEEVLSQQSDAMRDGLIRTAILDRFCAPLCAALFGSSAAAAEACPGEAFVQFATTGAALCSAIDERHQWYRYQRLFRQFLQRQLGIERTADEIAELHRRAAAWFETQALPEDAIPHLLAAAGAGAAGQLLVRQQQWLLDRQQRRRLAHCLRLLPPDSVENDPEVLLLKAWLMHHQGRHIETPAVLDRIEALLGTDPPRPEAQRLEDLRGGILSLRSVQDYLHGRAELAGAAAEQALQQLSEEATHARVNALTVLALSRQMNGQLEAARQGIQQALTRAAGPIDRCQAPLVATLCFIDWVAADLSALQWTARQNYQQGDGSADCAGNSALGSYFLGLVQYQRNELLPAEATLAPALAAGAAPPLGYRTEISFALAAVYQALGQADRACAIVDTVCEHLSRNGDSPALFRALAFRAEIALRQGRVSEAMEWARNFDPGPVRFVYRFFSAPHLTLVRTWIAEGSAESREQAARLLQLLEAEMQSRYNLRFLIEVLALQALLQVAQGHDAVAGDVLGRAVALARPAGFIRLFVDLGSELAKPLKRLLADPANARYVGQILAALSDEWLVTAGRQQVGADLTRRELKILKLLAGRLSNVEISQELCISRATVKRHTQNIYRKLRASSRGEAVTRARTLKVLSDG